MFDLIKGVGHATLDHGNVLYVVWVSYSEIYKESIYDLLATYSPTQKRTPLELKLDADKNVYVRGMLVNTIRAFICASAFQNVLFDCHNG